MRSVLACIILSCFWVDAIAVKHNDNVFTIDTGIVFPEAEIINEHTARIPFKLVDHLIVIEAELLNKKGDFIIDTGSEALLLNSVHFSNEYSTATVNRKSAGVLNQIEDLREKYLQEFILNNFSLKNKRSDIIDLSHIEKTKKINLLGIIGYTVLRDYEVFIDLYLNQITLTKVNPNGDRLNKRVYAEKITDSLHFNLKGHTIVLNGEINGEGIKLALDSGAEFNQLNKKVSRRIYRNFSPERRIKLMGASKRTIEVITGKLHRLKFSNSIYTGPMQTIITNLNSMNEAFGTSLDGVIGYEFLRQKRTIINYQKEMLFFIDYPIVFND
ncbi:hypothetical protein GCM10009117_16870 [Gangjinia marincola]|uniref:Aspartyl protease n=1 Tax=Gangjinia marincola TaxID=578463 RepID=A0ABN1MHD2_9FLAO